jgi:hypothetical protein
MNFTSIEVYVVEKMFMRAYLPKGQSNSRILGFSILLLIFE